jgi:hypothetical protein
MSIVFTVTVIANFVALARSGGGTPRAHGALNASGRRGK